MGRFGKFFNRPPTKDQFARMLVKRINASGDHEPVTYDPEQFSLRNSPDRVSFLNNTYQQYLRLPESEHEELIRIFLTSWHTTGFQPSDDFADAKPDLLPVLRPRSYFEVDAHRVADALHSKLDIPYTIIAEHLAETLVYDLPKTMMSVNNERLDKWGVSFYEAMEVAKRNLHDKPIQIAEIGSLHIVGTGDAYDASRMLLTEFVRDMQVLGDTVAMVPNRERLYICGTNDDAGLVTMIKMVTQDFNHERNISGLAFRFIDDGWEVWMPTEGHVAHNDFNALRLQSLGQEYAAQKDLLDKRHQLDETDIFVASYIGFENRAASWQSSYCTWSRDVESLLPETDIVAFFDPLAPKDRPIVASGKWTAVRQIVGDVMEPQNVYPTRWRVNGFPTAGMLKEIGNVLSA